MFSKLALHMCKVHPGGMGGTACTQGLVFAWRSRKQRGKICSNISPANRVLQCSSSCLQIWSAMPASHFWHEVKVVMVASGNAQHKEPLGRQPECSG